MILELNERSRQVFRQIVDTYLETGEPIVPRQESGEPRPLREEELKSLSAFSDFIDTLNLEDLGKGESPSPGGTEAE